MDDVLVIICFDFLKTNKTISSSRGEIIYSILLRLYYAKSVSVKDLVSAYIKKRLVQIDAII